VLKEQSFIARLMVYTHRMSKLAPKFTFKPDTQWKSGFGPIESYKKALKFGLKRVYFGVL